MTKETELHENFQPPGKLPAWDGRRYRDIRVAESKDRDGETVIHFNDPSGSMSVRLDAADLSALRAALAEPVTVEQVSDFLRGFFDSIQVFPATPGDHRAVAQVLALLEARR